MRRITTRYTDEQIEAIEARVDAGEFPNRSELIRTAVRELLDEDLEQPAPSYRVRADGGRDE